MPHHRDDERGWPAGRGRDDERGRPGERGGWERSSDRLPWGYGAEAPRAGAWQDEAARRHAGPQGWRGEQEFAPWGTSEGSVDDELSYGATRPGYGAEGAGRRQGGDAYGWGARPGPWVGPQSTRPGDRGSWYGSAPGEAGPPRSERGGPASGFGGYGEPGGGWRRLTPLPGRSWDRGPGEADLGGRFAGRGPKGYQRSRERILDDACQRLADHPEIDASEIEVDVQGDVVVLRGQVHDRGQKRMAEDTVEFVSGVRDVRNELDVEKGMLATLTDAVTGRSRDDEELGDTRATPRKARHAPTATS